LAGTKRRLHYRAVLSALVIAVILSLMFGQLARHIAQSPSGWPLEKKRWTPAVNK